MIEFSTNDGTPAGDAMPPVTFELPMETVAEQIDVAEDANVNYDPNT
jgi:hypothetical protein